MAVGDGMVVVAVRGGFRQLWRDLTEMPLRKFIIYIILTVDLTPVTKVTNSVNLSDQSDILKT